MSRNLDAIARLWTAVLLAIAAWSGYQLGWGRAPDVPGSAVYAGKGLESLAHIELASICLGTGVVFFPIFLGLVFSRRRPLIRDWLDLALVVGLLTSLSFYQVAIPYVGSNYYLSRYFLPLVVPFTSLFVLRRVAAWRALRFWLVTAAVLSFNLIYSSFLATTPEFEDTNSLIAQLKRVIPKDSIVLGLGREPHFDWLFANVVRYDLEARYGSLGSQEREGLRLLQQFREEEGPQVLFVVSDRPLPLEPPRAPVQELKVVDNVYFRWSGVLYPLTSQRVERTYLVYRLSSA